MDVQGAQDDHDNGRVEAGVSSDLNSSPQARTLLLPGVICHHKG
jgi:hypothetical protein